MAATTRTPDSPHAPIVTLTVNPALDLSTGTDRLVPEHKLRCGPSVVEAGGGGVNVSRVIARLGGASTALVTVGGATGGAYHDLLAAEAASLAALPGDGAMSTELIPIAGATRQNITIDETATGSQFRFVLQGPTLSDDEGMRCLDTLEGALPTGPGFVVLSGSLPPGAPDDLYARAVQREMDLSAWLRGGPWVFVAMVGITVVFALGVSALRRGGNDEFVPLIVGDAVMTLVIIGVLRAAHRFATANVVGRRVAAVLVLSGLWVLAYDLFAWRMHWSVALASSHKLLAIAALHVSCAALGMTALRGVAALALLSAALVAALPGQVYVITPAAFVALTATLWFLARSGRLRSEDALR